MKQLKLLSVNELVYDNKMYPRITPDEDTIERYSKALASGANFPPITVVKRKNDNKFVVIDGRHRLEAHRRNNEEHIQTEVVSGMDAKQLYELAVQTNITHGKPFSQEEVEKIIITLKDFEYDLDSISKVVRLPVSEIEHMTPKLERATPSKRLLKEPKSMHKARLMKSEVEYEDNPEKEFVPKQVEPYEQTSFSNKEQIELLDTLIMLLKNNWINKYHPQIKEKMFTLGDILNELGDILK